MKIIHEETKEKTQKLVLELPESTLETLDELAQAEDVSRRKLIVAILQQALADKSFVLRLKG